MSTSPSENARHAIELMTSWLESPNEMSDLFLGRLRLQIGGRPDGDMVAGAVELVMGLTLVCGDLLVTLAQETGTSEGEALRRLALAYAVQD